MKNFKLEVAQIHLGVIDPPAVPPAMKAQKKEKVKKNKLKVLNASTFISRFENNPN